MKATRSGKTRRRARSEHEALRKRLMRRREELLRQMHGELADSRRDAGGAGYDDVADRASDALYDELAKGFAEIASADLRKIDRALEKMDDRTYGLCEICGRSIPRARLRMLPFAELCVDCQRQEEAERPTLPGYPRSAPSPDESS